jgi:hypothetical protein
MPSLHCKCSSIQWGLAAGRDFLEGLQDRFAEKLNRFAAVRSQFADVRNQFAAVLNQFAAVKSQSEAETRQFITKKWQF